MSTQIPANWASIGTLSASGITITTNSSFPSWTIFVGVDPAQSKDDTVTRSLEDIALRLDELAVEHPDIPDLMSLNEELTEHFGVTEKMQERIDQLQSEVDRLRSEEVRDRGRQTYEEWKRQQVVVEHARHAFPNHTHAIISNVV